MVVRVKVKIIMPTWVKALRTQNVCLFVCIYDDDDELMMMIYGGYGRQDV